MKVVCVTGKIESLLGKINACKLISASSNEGKLLHEIINSIKPVNCVTILFIYVTFP
jgi:hypothetical protein